MRHVLLAATALTFMSTPGLAQTVKVPPAITVTEGQSWSVPVDRVGGKGTTIPFSYQTRNGSALAGQDYSIRAGNQSIRKNTTRYTLTGPTLDDTAYEPDEVFELQTITSSQTLTTSITIKDNDPAPPLPITCPDGSVVIPPMTCPEVPTDPLAGKPPIPSNFDTAPYLLDTSIPPSADPDDKGAFRFICNAGQLSYDDPIVYPDQPGKSHLHQYYGNTSADSHSTYETLRDFGVSSCEGLDHPALNRSAYWMPAMLWGQNVVRPDFVAIYYKRKPKTDPKCSLTSGDAHAQGNCVDLPNGLKFIFGYDMITQTTPTGKLWFNCQGPGSVSGHYTTLPQAEANCPAGAQLGAVIEAPDCWNGKDLDSPNHRDHVSYGSYGTWGYYKCPSTHPYVIPAFTLGAWYTRPAGVATGSWRFSSDDMFPNLPTGTTFHADFFMAWDPTVKVMWHDNCINKKLNCSAGDTGGGKRIKGMEVRQDPAPKVVPIPVNPALAG